MSESQGRAGGARYQRSSGGLVGALLITVLAVIAFTVFRGVIRDDSPTPVRAVDYMTAVDAARADQQLLVMAPDRLPIGWKMTSATYDDGPSPAWHLGALTDDTKYVGVEESRSSIEDLVEEHVDEAAERGKDIAIAGETWQTWTDAGGDYAVARSLEGASGTESVLVVGTAPEEEIRDFAGSLEAGPVPAAG